MQHPKETGDLVKLATEEGRPIGEFEIIIKGKADKYGSGVVDSLGG